VIDAILERRYPEALQPDERVIYEFITELLRDSHVGVDTHAAVVEAFGARGAVELSTLVGYYTLLAYVLTAHEVALPPGADEPFIAN